MRSAERLVQGLSPLSWRCTVDLVRVGCVALWRVLDFTLHCHLFACMSWVDFPSLAFAAFALQGIRLRVQSGVLLLRFPFRDGFIRGRLSAAAERTACRPHYYLLRWYFSIPTPDQVM